MKNPENELPPAMKICPTCEGACKVYRPIRMRAGMVERLLPCYTCNGEGEIEEDAQDAKDDAAEARREARRDK
jgi:DnaJ-class molecular chaperone